ncbi:hypothetical protein HPB49_012221 [Dermacentor silvarum]|uniref:Uncharacterized protein n=1 Tax=Dermacentor silvarum TaxID=543639 RepID=A0ACB8C3I4_DERSI|nr:hypothetical protein HPB49_012221 [Dermacentor silvarum]
MAALLEDVHEGLGLPPQASRTACVKGKYAYYHYGCDGVDDRGWGCGYRTLQTICSWVVYQKHKTGEGARAVPSIAEIQAALVTLGDKESQFSGSRDWIGSTEVFLCLDHFYQHYLVFFTEGVAGKEPPGSVPVLVSVFAVFSKRYVSSPCAAHLLAG